MVAVGQVVTSGGSGGPHTHAWSDVTGEPDFALTGHTHTAPAWGDVTGKPSTFTPSAHTHAITDTTGLQAALDSKATAAALTALDTATSTALAGKADTGHTHTAAPVIMKRWNGSAYVDASDARIYVGVGDPGVMPEGSVWIGPS